MNMESQQLLTERSPVPQLSPAHAQAKPEPMAARQKSRTLLPALATALLLWACYFPLNAGGLAWVALVPLLCLVRSTARPRVIYSSTWVGGMAFFLIALQWLR